MKKELTYLLMLVVLAGLTFWLDPDFFYASQQKQTDRRAANDYVLAVSWQPAFCERLPNKPECRSQHQNRFDASNFTLHGLWPQPKGTSYCNLPENIVTIDKTGRWHELPKLDLSETLRKELSEKMPGYRSHLHRHEWYKHGSCMPGYSPEDYFTISLKLLDSINESEFANLFRGNKGRKLFFRDMNFEFVQAFGVNAQQKLVVDCYRDDGRRIFQEFKLSLSGLVSINSDLSELLAKSKSLGSSCPSGLVDRVGLQ